jgi:hypothetical protein
MKKVFKIYDSRDEEVRVASYPPTVKDTLTESGMKQLYLRGTDVLISESLLSSDFLPIEESKEIIYNNGIVVPFFSYYSHNSLPLAVQVTKDLEKWDSNTNCVIASGEIENHLPVVSIMYGKTSIEEVISYVNENFTSMEDVTTPRVSLLMTTGDGIILKPSKMNPLPINIDTMYNDDFSQEYGFIIDKLKNQDTGLFLLHGEPGTGKTNLIKHLTSVVDKSFVFIPTGSIGLLSDTNFLTTVLQKGKHVLVLEDCEDYLQPRSFGYNNSEVISTILNLTDGMLSDVSGVQVICTFNTDIKKIDSALLRKGRLVCKYEFKKLKKDKANKLLETLGLPTTLETDTSLTDVFNCAERAFTDKASNIGFNF